MLDYALRRLLRLLLSTYLLLMMAALLTVWGEGCVAGPCDSGQTLSAVLGWISAALRLDLGETLDHGPVTAALATAAPASLLLLAAALLCRLTLGWGSGLVLGLLDGAGSRSWRPARLLARGWAVLLDLAQSLPTFWLGGLLVALISVGAGWLPAGGIVTPTLPAFGSAAYSALWQQQPWSVLGDLLAHLALPALTLALVGAGAEARLLSATLVRARHAPYTRVARASGLRQWRWLTRALRVELPALCALLASGLPVRLGALVLVEYLFGWPGLGMLAYHAARVGDSALLSALLLLSGGAAVLLSALADLLAAWADPRHALF